ncbi:FAD-dependent oxidoreductase [Geobacillus thermoleovorans]|uniref:FAD-dependent oxidoreductase n=1 Tax=Geobacillus thermoleovorans TaxID=33941 RepID=UPI003D20B468
MAVSKEMEYVYADVLVIGGGQAALRAAIAAREAGASVAMASKGRIGSGGSSVISDGVHSAIFTDGDSPENFFEDIMRGGRWINDPDLVRIFTVECTSRVQELAEKFGVNLHFERQVATPGHSFPRRVYAGEGNGRSVTQALREYARSIGIHFYEQTWVIDLLQEERVNGAVGLHGDEWIAFFAGSTILASGGIGGLYANSDNPNDVTGEGIGMAWRHGAALRDMEFVQFYPYRLVYPRNLDLYTKIFAKGAKMFNEKGERFMEGYPKKELETRDVLCYEMYRQRKIFLDISAVKKEDLAADSHRLYQLLEKGYNGELLLAPVEHYSIGGIQVDGYGRTGVEGFYACGECTGGLHGANRLGGGALTEALVFGARAGWAAAQESLPMQRRKRGNVCYQMFFNVRDLLSEEAKAALAQLRKRVQEIMWNRAGIERTLSGLRTAVGDLRALTEALDEGEFPEIQGVGKQVAEDMIRASWLVCHSASLREESRGAHRLAECPTEREEFVGNFVIRGESCSFIPVSTNGMEENEKIENGQKQRIDKKIGTGKTDQVRER